MVCFERAGREEEEFFVSFLSFRWYFGVRNRVELSKVEFRGSRRMEGKDEGWE